MKKIKILTIIFLLFFAFGVRAEGVKVSPSVIDEKVKAKDILKYVVKIKNEKTNKVELYAILFDILPDGSRTIATPSELNRKTSITKWTSIKRGVISLDPGAEIEVPLQIDVDLTATPGSYHSVVAFSEGSNREIAVANANAASQILINIEVGDQIVEKAQIEKFAATKNVFTKYPAIFNLQIKNNGNAAVIPTGEILIYNRRNQQVGQVDVNSLGDAIEKESSKQFEIQWTNDADGFGKFKAKLEAEYGNKAKRDLQDTIYFWVFPTKYLVIFGLGLFMLTFLLTFLLFRKSQQVKYGHRADNDIYEDDEDESEPNNGRIINLKS